ncbi:MAG: diaminopimelate epimerase, partial [Acidobacteria bacterium]|nr:diaminopimelate epimerase [Acidobacteriota bacterium]
MTAPSDSGTPGEPFAFFPFSFFRVSGAGNDFIALPEPPRSPTAGEVRAWCRRGVSLGADGVFALRRETGTSTARPRVVMEHWNADGSKADLCLNGTRCAARLAMALGWAESEVEVRTGAGPVDARAAGPDRILLDLPLLPGPIESVRTEIDGEEISGSLLVVGVPHLVLPWVDDLDDAPVERLGRALVHHPVAGPAGANIDFLRVTDRHHLELRTYERGVYAETLACGTGVMAAAAV